MRAAIELVEIYIRKSNLASQILKRTKNNYIINLKTHLCQEKRSATSCSRRPITSTVALNTVKQDYISRYVKCHNKLDPENVLYCKVRKTKTLSKQLDFLHENIFLHVHHVNRWIILTHYLHWNVGELPQKFTRARFKLLHRYLYSPADHRYLITIKPHKITVKQRFQVAKSHMIN